MTRPFKTTSRPHVQLLGAVLLSTACQAGAGGSALQAQDTGAYDASGGAVATDGGPGMSDAGAVDVPTLTPDANLDAGPSTDARPAADAAPLADTAVPAPDAAVGACPDRPAIAPDAERVVLVGLPFTEQPGVRGTEIRGLMLESEGTLDDDGIRLDVGTAPARIAFAPHGITAFVLGEDGQLVSVFVANAEGMAVIDRVQLPGADYGDLHVSADGATIWVTGSNSDASSGISTVHVDCEGGLTLDEPAFFPLRLSESTAFLPGDERAVLLGGQAVFEPVDTNDIRLIERQPAGGFHEVGAFDVYHDFVSAGRIAASPDGRLVAVPNNSPFSEEGSEMVLLGVDGDAVREVDRVQSVEDASEALFSLDGQTLLLTQVEPGRVDVYSIADGRIAGASVITGIGLADQMARVERGPMADTILLPSIDPNGGPNISVLRITGPGQVEDLGEHALGDGARNIATAIAVQP